MIKTQSYRLKFITPCFCAGADQSMAELRASAIRGALRWWFRVLGASHEDEKIVFGGLGDSPKTVKSSALIVRTEIVKLGPSWDLPEFTANDTSSYVWHFVAKSGVDASQNDIKNKKGPRWSPDAYLPPKTEWKLHLLFKHDLPSQLTSKLEDAITCFLMLGSIGLRVTRGLGAFSCVEKPFDVLQLTSILSNENIQCELKDVCRDVSMVVEKIGSLVKGTRKAQGWRNDSQNGDETPSPMGTSKPRQTSAIYFRPIETSNGGLQIVVFEAPHERVLGKLSHKQPIVGEKPSKIVPAKVYRR